MTLRAVLRDLCPPVIPKLVRGLRRSSSGTLPDETILFDGDYQSWEDAEHASTGYADREILSKTRAAMLKVKRGDAAFERDSVTFQVMEHRFPLLAGLLRAAVASQGRLNIVDFGGALGSTYFQCRQFLSVVRELRWSIVEQPDHVACGVAEFSDEHLRFYRSIEDCLQTERPNLLLTSSVVQYLPKPYAALEDLLRHGFDHVIIDRAPFLLRNQDRLTVETVPESIYQAKYPAWFFNESRFRQTLTDAGYFLVADFNALDTCAPVDESACYKGFILEKRPSRGGSGGSAPR
jgi:putative methyltransferase (TIGR04325 family)